MTSRSRLLVPLSVCCACLAAFGSLALSAERVRGDEVRFQPGSAAPGADWVGCGEGRYWSAYGARGRSAWSASAVSQVDASAQAEAREGRARPGARGNAGYVDLGR